MHLQIINGPNINLLGSRENSIYGDISFDAFFNQSVTSNFSNITYLQSNIEGEIIDALQKCTADGIILNAAGYTHTSIAIADAIKAIQIPVIEVHISNIYAREKERHISLIQAACLGSIAGFGLHSYIMAIEYFTKYFHQDN
jgi:3-dehydroquinate dehydratase II